MDGATINAFSWGLHPVVEFSNVFRVAVIQVEGGYQRVEWFVDSNYQLHTCATPTQSTADAARTFSSRVDRSNVDTGCFGAAWIMPTP